MQIETRIRDSINFSLNGNDKIEILVNGEVKKTWTVPSGKKVEGTAHINGLMEDM